LPTKPPAGAGGEALAVLIKKKEILSARIEQGLAAVLTTERSPKMDNKSLAHSKWNCKYHIVFAPKYRRRVIYGELKKEIGQILRRLCEA